MGVAVGCLCVCVCMLHIRMMSVMSLVHIYDICEVCWCCICGVKHVSVSHMSWFTVAASPYFGTQTESPYGSHNGNSTPGAVLGLVYTMHKY